jgi:hypothetical protein
VLRIFCDMIRRGRKRLWRDHGWRLLRVVENLADDFNDAVEEVRLAQQ